MQSLLKKVQAHMPFRELYDRYLPMVLKEGLHPEISFDQATLERFAIEDYRQIGAKLQEKGLTVTFHAPFMDLRPGAIDPEIRRISRERIGDVLKLAPYFRPRAVVCHPSFDDRYYVSTEALWLNNSLETWGALIGMADEMDTTLCLENVYEKHPHLLQRLLSALESPRLRFCFDTGHCNVFSRVPLEDWIHTLAPYLFELHLHDNGGAADEHLAVGHGTFPFPGLFHMLREKGIRPIMTLEAHNEKNLWQSLENLKALGVI